MPPILIVLCGCVAVLAFDAAGSLIARRSGIDYRRLALGSLVIYALFGFLAAGAAGAVIYGSLAGAAAAATDATVGWRISRALGADRQVVSERVEMGTATMVTILGALIGTVGALLS